MDKESSPPLWKASVAVPKETAGDVAALFELTPPAPQAVLIVEDPFGPEAIVEALYDAPADAELLSRLTGRAVLVAPLPDQDWIKQSQEGLPPVRAGRFFVYGAHDAGAVPAGVIPIRIEAGLAFGTGHHETTALCLPRLVAPGQAAAFHTRAGSGLRHRGAGHRRGEAVAGTRARDRHRRHRG